MSSRVFISIMPHAAHHLRTVWPSIDCGNFVKFKDLPAESLGVFIEVGLYTCINRGECACICNICERASILCFEKK